MEPDVELSTMMKSPCLRYRGDFVAMIFERENALIVKLSPKRVDELIALEKGRAFNFTKKRFKEWVIIDRVLSDTYTNLINEALAYAKAGK